MTDICRHCGCTAVQAIDDAKSLGFGRELQNGTYTCCQVVAWADEQWLAWMEAAEEDGMSPDGLTSPVKEEQETMVVRVITQRTQDSRFTDSGGFR